MHIKNIDIFIALSTIMLQLPTEVENSLLNPIWMMIFFSEQVDLGKKI